MVSFCGYFPSDDPQYSCLVCIVKTGIPASGGGQAGPVFSEISQYIMAKGMYRSTETAADSNSVFVPELTKSDPEMSRSLLKQLDLSEEGVVLSKEDSIPFNKVPDVKGMGARDAVFALQERGLKVKVVGLGRVSDQNMPPGTEVVKGKTITLTLKNH
jgi:cell division protein FtsI (penicillin-binding protein 3)